MVFPKLPFARVNERAKLCVPSRRNVLSGSAVVAIALLAGPVGLATANAVSSSPAAASVHVRPATASKTAPAAKPAAHNPPPVAKTVSTKTAVAVAAVKPAVTLGQLEPSGLYGGQEHFTPSSDQWQNAKTIVQVARQRSLSPYAAVIAVAVAMQESSLHNDTAAVNADSLGLFQQRPSMGWGSPSQLTDPSYATTAFLSALTQDAPGYGSMPLWQAAQDTQRSGYPTAYAHWEDQAAHMVQQLVGG